MSLAASAGSRKPGASVSMEAQSQKSGPGSQTFFIHPKVTIRLTQSMSAPATLMSGINARAVMNWASPFHVLALAGEHPACAVDVEARVDPASQHPCPWAAAAPCRPEMTFGPSFWGSFNESENRPVRADSQTHQPRELPCPFRPTGRLLRAVPTWLPSTSVSNLPATSRRSGSLKPLALIFGNFRGTLLVQFRPSFNPWYSFH